jgi:lysozyme
MSAGTILTPAPASLHYYPIAIQTQIRYADVSFWQGDINFEVMGAVLDGVIIRAGQRNWEDSRFRENWRKAKEAGLPRGSYFLYDSRADPKKQAALWWSLIKDDPGELVHVADLEENYGGPYGTPAHMRTFIQEFQRLSGLPDDRIVVYTGFFWWTERVGNDSFFRRFALWIAWYASMNAVQVPAPWIETDLFGWQYTSSGPGPLYGVSSLEIDLNWYCCSAATYSKRFNLGAPPPPNPDEDTMYYYKWNANGANIRNGPGARFTDLGDILRDDVVSAQEAISGPWINIDDARHPDGSPVLLADGSKVSDHPDCWMTTSYLVQVDSFPEPPSPPPPPPTPSHLIEIYENGVLVYRKELL